MVLVLFAVSVLTFLIFNVDAQLRPGAAAWRARTRRRQLIASITEEWGFDDSLPQQYLTMMRKIFSGDLISYEGRETSTNGSSKGFPPPSRSASAPR